MYAILYSDGELQKRDIIKECSKEKWVPIFAYKDSNNEDPNLSIIPLFQSPNDARGFIKRNFPSDWIDGAIFVTDKNIDWMENQGWCPKEFTFARKMKELPNITFGFEILEFFTKPSVWVHNKNSAVIKEYK